MEAEYERLAPNPDDFENLVWKLKTRCTEANRRVRWTW